MAEKVEDGPRGQETPRRFRRGDAVRFKAEAPDALFPPFDREMIYEVQSVRGKKNKGNYSVALPTAKFGGPIHHVSASHLEFAGEYNP